MRSEDAARDLLSAEPGLELAVLFGSTARHDAAAGSDLDIAVLGVPSERLSMLQAELERIIRTPVDLVAIEAAPPLLRFEMARDGIVLIERTPHRWSDVRARAMVDWWDWAPTARLFQQAAVSRLKGGDHGQA